MANMITPKNMYVTETALDYDPSAGWKVDKIEYPMPEDEAIVGYGRSITTRAFRRMVGDKLLQLKNEHAHAGGRPEHLMEYLTKKKCSIDFGKDSILRILSQRDCIGLRLTFCINDEMEESIIVSGLTEIEEHHVVDGQSKKIKKACFIHKNAYQINSDPAITPMDEEKGVGLTYGDFVKEAGVSLDELMNNTPKAVKIITDKIFGL